MSQTHSGSHGKAGPGGRVPDPVPLAAGASSSRGDGEAAGLGESRRGGGGDPPGWEMVQLHQAALVRYAAHLTGDGDVARDIVQDVFMRFFREGPQTLAGREAQWLYTVCRNRAYDMLRRHNRTVPLDDAHAAVLACPSSPSPAAAAEAVDSNRHVARAMATLPPRQREAVTLKFQAGLSYKEIAAIMELTVNHVGVLLHTALQRLREELREDLALGESRASASAPGARPPSPTPPSTSPAPNPSRRKPLTLV